ncbi:hypothetical protein [Haloglomus salinum]|uniref:hypothetical protein n=1 Tax=Haloglomus salinum TaxID=2962673 RepID=UPI0020C941F1|nr:hypothetical protein [Haloglomus salinum]
MCAATSLGQLSYASFYLPSLGFGVLATTSDNPIYEYIHPDIANTILFGPSAVFYALTALTFLGAMQAHGISRLIFGPDGPSARPKNTTAHLRHTLAIVLDKEANQFPIIPCRIAQQGFTRHLLDYLRYKMVLWLYSAADNPETHTSFKELFGEVPKRHRLEIGYEQLESEAKSWSWRTYFRIAFFLPMGLLKHLSWLSLALLVALGALSTVSYAILLLIFAHSVLLFRGWVWSFLPDYVNYEAVDDQFIAEYEFYEGSGAQNTQKRIETERG